MQTRALELLRVDFAYVVAFYVGYAAPSKISSEWQLEHKEQSRKQREYSAFRSMNFVPDDCKASKERGQTSRRP